MFNQAMLMGRICHDLEMKSTQNGVPVLSFRIAVDRNYQVKGEERKADFFNVVTWRSTAEFVSKYFYKGRMIMVCGELQTRQYDKDGHTVNVVELVADSVHFTGEKKKQNSQQQGYSQGGNYSHQPGGEYEAPYGGSAQQPQYGVYGAPPAGSPQIPTQQQGNIPPATPEDEDDYPF